MSLVLGSPHVEMRRYDRGIASAIPFRDLMMELCRGARRTRFFRRMTISAEFSKASTILVPAICLPELHGLPCGIEFEITRDLWSLFIWKVAQLSTMMLDTVTITLR